MNLHDSEWIPEPSDPTLLRKVRREWRRAACAAATAGGQRQWVVPGRYAWGRRKGGWRWALCLPPASGPQWRARGPWRSTRGCRGGQSLTRSSPLRSLFGLAARPLEAHFIRLVCHCGGAALWMLSPFDFPFHGFHHPPTTPAACCWCFCGCYRSKLVSRRPRRPTMWPTCGRSSALSSTGPSLTKRAVTCG